MISRCSTCPHTNRCVPADGPTPCRVLFIGEAPGKDEDQGGRPFIGRAGGAFNYIYLPLAGLHRSTRIAKETNIRITNSVRCRPNNNRTPYDWEIQGCADHHLPGELERTKPEIIVPMGGVACSLFEDVRLEVHHGFPLKRTLYGNQWTIFPVYHPALGMHDTGKIRLIRDDFKALGEFLNGNENWPEDKLKGRERYRVAGREEIQKLRRAKTFALDTESDGGLWSYQFSLDPGEGSLVKASDREGMRELQAAIDRVESVEIHNSPYDVGELLKAGIIVPWDKVRDTMIFAYRLGLPQGLKALAFRLCSMEMQEFEDLVAPYGRKEAIRWLEEVLLWLPSIDEHYVTPKKQEQKVRVVANPIANLIKRLHRYTVGSEKYNPWKSMKEAREKLWDVELEWLGKVEGKFGKMPTPGISRVPFAKALKYASRDTDAGIRVSAVMKEKMGSKEFRIQEKDVDRR